MYSTGLLILSILLGAYALFTLLLSYYWHRLPSTPAANDVEMPRITVIIPVRNEAENIVNLLEDLNSQQYPVSGYEVILADDASTDATVALAASFLPAATYSLKILRLDEIQTGSPKKRAILAAIQQATGALIITTDGDCRVGSNWLRAFAEAYVATRAKLISGPVTFTQEISLFAHLQTVEFSSLIGSGGSSIGAGIPTLCNGANLAYEKEAFYEVGGFSGNEQLASGDDEFLLHKIARRYSNGVHFLKDERAIVQTTPHTNFLDFYRQRKRWASKWKHYKNPPSLLFAVFVFAANAALLVAPLLGFTGTLTWGQVLGLMLLKWVPEWFYIGTILTFLNKGKSLSYIPLVQLIYPFYVTLFGLVAQKPAYVWKGRKLR